MMETNSVAALTFLATTKQARRVRERIRSLRDLYMKISNI
jgi:hypothetical protein